MALNLFYTTRSTEVDENNTTNRPECQWHTNHIPGLNSVVDWVKKILQLVGPLDLQKILDTSFLIYKLNKKWQKQHV